MEATTLKTQELNNCSSDGLYYIYRHVRLDKNVPFYIGVGKKNLRFNNGNKIYGRAYANTGRNILWDAINNKTEKEVEILIESDDYKFIKEKENEFINLYGRLILDSGTLSNFLNSHYSPCRQRTEMSDAAKERRRKRFVDLNKSRIGKTHYNTSSDIYIYSLDGDFVKKEKSLNDASISLHISVGSIIGSINDRKSTKGYFFSKVDMGHKLDISKYRISGIIAYDSISTPINRVDEHGNVLEQHKSIKEAARFYKLKPCRISANIRRGSKSRTGMIFKYQT